MALNANALTTTAHARLYVRRNVGLELDSELADVLINAYSSAVGGYCDREFTATSSTSRVFDYSGGGTLSLAPYELRTLTTITYTTYDTAATTVETADYSLRPRNKTGQSTYLWVHFRKLTGRPWGGYAITIVGDWGMTAVPADVELACLIAVADGFRNPEGAAARAVGDLTYSEPVEPIETPARSLPPDARALLAPYRRTNI